MRINKAKFVTSKPNNFEGFNDKIPEIAIVGKSNVGKSSLINMLTNNGSLAKVSKMQGKTRLVNYFMINDSFYLVDLPGYGFANTSKDMQNSWVKMMNGYFANATQLKMLLLLIDIRRDPTEQDIQMIEYARQYNIPVEVLATKADKIAKSKRFTEGKRILRQLVDYRIEQIIPVSNEEFIGKKELLELIGSYL